jgi:hypothetical protein
MHRPRLLSDNGSSYVSGDLAKAHGQLPWRELRLVTVLTSVTGFLFPIHGFTPALGVGIVSCAILVIALFAYYRERLIGAWRWIYVATAIASLAHALLEKLPLGQAGLMEFQLTPLGPMSPLGSLISAPAN